MKRLRKLYKKAEIVENINTPIGNFILSKNPNDEEIIEIKESSLNDGFNAIINESLYIWNSQLRINDLNQYLTNKISLHSLQEEKRNWLIPFKNKMTIEELGQIRTQSNLKTTINLTLVDTDDFDIDKLTKYFDKDYFFVKLSPINKNTISEENQLGDGIIKAVNLI